MDFGDLDIRLEARSQNTTTTGISNRNGVLRSRFQGVIYSELYAMENLFRLTRVYLQLIANPIYRLDRVFNMGYCAELMP